MGTNYYFFIKNKKLVRDNFGVRSEYGDYMDEIEYQIVDTPELGYLIHLNKCSYGWRTLFQRHKAFKSFKELENFYHKHQKSIKIYDEYDREYSWDDYKAEVIGHSNVEAKPVKWVYEEDIFLGRPGYKYFRIKNCSEDEAELYTPLNHLQYFETEVEAGRKFGVQVWDSNMNYSSDPDYPVDWCDGEFS